MLPCLLLWLGTGFAAAQEAPVRTVKLKLGKIIAVDKQENPELSPLLRGMPLQFQVALSNYENQSGKLKLVIGLGGDEELEIDKQIEDEELRSMALKASTRQRLHQSQVSYFVFLTYRPVAGSTIRMIARLASVEQTGTIATREDEIDAANPNFNSLGQQIYADLLANEKLEFTPRSYPLKVCDFQLPAASADMQANYASLANILRTKIQDSLLQSGPRVMKELKQGGCAATDPRDQADKMLLVRGKIDPHGKELWIEVQVIYGDTLVAVVMPVPPTTEDDFAKDLDRLINTISAQLRTECDRWRPPA